MDAISGVSAYTLGIELGFDTSTSSEGRQNSARGGRVSSIKPARENTDSTGLNLTPEEKDKIREMRLRDQEVRTHEQAHMAAAAGVSSGGPTYTYRKGPDGKMYAVAGEVQIDTSPEKDPEDTIAKARQIKAAASAPAEPSAQDKAVAAQAAQMEADARKELQAERAEEQGAASQSGVTRPGTQPTVSSSVQDISPDKSWTLQSLGSLPAYSAAQAQTSTHLQSTEGTRHDAQASRGFDQAGIDVDADRAIQSRSASIRALSSGHFFLSRPQEALLASSRLSEGMPPATAAPRAGWAQSGDRASFAGTETNHAEARPAELQRAALAYQNSQPSTGLAPHGTGISLAV